MEKPTKKDIKRWMKIYRKYRPFLRPDNKPAEQVLDYVKSRYPYAYLTDPRYKEVIKANVDGLEFMREKLQDREPDIVVMKLKYEGAALEHYKRQEKAYKDTPIYFGLEMNTGYIYVEGSDSLYRELTLYRGLDSYDLANPFIVAQYVEFSESGNAAADSGPESLNLEHKGNPPSI